MRRPEKLEAQDLTIRQLLLMLLASRETGVHGYEFGPLIDRSAVGNGSIYRSLARLAELGFLDGAIEDTESADLHTGPARRIFKVTEEGKEILGDTLNLVDTIRSRTAPTNTEKPPLEEVFEWI